MANPDAPRFRFRGSASCTFTQPNEALSRRQLPSCADLKCSNCPVEAGLRNLGLRHDLAYADLPEKQIRDAFRSEQVGVNAATNSQGNQEINITCALPEDSMDHQRGIPLPSTLFTRGGAVFEEINHG